MNWKTHRHLLIYGLVDPRTNNLMYVGKSSGALKRAKSHWSKTTLRLGRAKCDSWVRKLRSLNLYPVIEILEDFGIYLKEDIKINEILNISESFWIASVRASGAKLLNMTDGGDGLNGRLHTIETKEKMSIARKKRCSGMLGKKHSFETKVLMKEKALAFRGKTLKQKEQELELLKKDQAARYSVWNKKERNPFYGRKHTPESIEKMKAARNRRQKKNED